MASSERKLKQPLDKVLVKESMKKGLTIHYKNIKCVVASKQHKLWTTYQVQKFNILNSVDNKKYDAKIKSNTGIVKDAFQKLNKVLKDQKKSLVPSDDSSN